MGLIENLPRYRHHICFPIRDRYRTDGIELPSVNGDATGSFRVNLWVKKSLFFQLWENVSDLYTSTADTHLLHSLPAGAVYFGLFYKYI
jgi:hypothetical protein